MIKKLPWLWMVILVATNVIPIGNQANQRLNANWLLVFRLDYLIHSAMILCFAVIWILGKIMGVKWYGQHETLKFSLIVLATGIGLELIQAIIPWRSFNPVDMEYNLVGAITTMIIVFISQLEHRNHRMDR